MLDDADDVDRHMSGHRLQQLYKRLDKCRTEAERFLVLGEWNRGVLLNCELTPAQRQTCKSIQRRLRIMRQGRREKGRERDPKAPLLPIPSVLPSDSTLRTTQESYKHALQFIETLFYNAAKSDAVRRALEAELKNVSPMLRYRRMPKLWKGLAGRVASGKARAGKMDILCQQARDLRAAGFTFAQIGEKLECSESQAWNYINNTAAA